MIEALALLIMVASQPPASDAGTNARCRGIHMSDGTAEGTNLLSTTIRGPIDRVQPIIDRFEVIGTGIRIENWANGNAEIIVFYEDNLDARAIANLLDEIGRGAHGSVTTEGFTMPADTLPRGTCIRRF